MRVCLRLLGLLPWALKEALVSPEQMLKIPLAAAILGTTPLGLRLLLRSKGRWARFYRLAAPFGLLSLLFPVGPWAAGLAAVWLAFTIYPLVAVPLSEKNWCRRACTFYLPVGGFWLVLWRAGLRPLDYPSVIVGLTSVHFHYIGFAGQVLTAMLCQGHSRLTAAGRTVAVSPALVGLGIVGCRPLEVGAAACLIAALMVVGASGLVRSASWSGLARFGLVLSSLSVLLSMPLAALYAWGRWTNRYPVTIETMLWSHGGLNCLGFCLAGLVGWNLRASG
jgi:hypothetical protein